jgi:hypothetical protein
MQPIQDARSICQKINYTETRKQKQCYNKCWIRPRHSAMHVFILS